MIKCTLMQLQQQLLTMQALISSPSPPSVGPSQPCRRSPPRSSPGAGQAVPADDVADDVGVAHEDLVAVLLLLGVSSVDEVAKRGLDASSILVILLRAQGHSSQQHCLHPPAPQQLPLTGHPQG